MEAAVLTEPKQFNFSQRNTADVALDLSDNLPRYFVQYGLSIFRTDTEAIRGRKLLRGEIKPCMGYPKWDSIESIPSEMRMKGRTRTINRSTEGCYPIYADAEAERLKGIEARNPDGMYCLEILTGLQPSDYESCRFNEFFYPQGVENLPDLHSAVKTLILKRRDDLLNGDIACPRVDFKDVYVAVANELVKAIEYADQLQQSQLEHTHNRMRLASSDEQHKDKYDLRDEEKLKFTGKTRFEKHADVTSEALLMLAKNSAKPSGDAEMARALLEMVKVTQSQNDLLREQLEAAKAPPVQAPQPANQGSQKKN